MPTPTPSPSSASACLLVVTLRVPLVAGLATHAPERPDPPTPCFNSGAIRFQAQPSAQRPPSHYG
ncbi:MAG TPA: hypothetical protein VLQ93_02595 [Myxococcaceae bacterium]|nr:hypothetical protein [Myxococcaceae bacterium]